MWSTVAWAFAIDGDAHNGETTAATRATTYATGRLLRADRAAGRIFTPGIVESATSEQHVFGEPASREIRTREGGPVATAGSTRNGPGNIG